MSSRWSVLRLVYSDVTGILVISRITYLWICVWVRGWQSDWKYVSGLSPGSLAGVLHHGSLPSNNSVRGRKGRKLSWSEFSLWAGHSGPCCAVTEVGWLLKSPLVKLQDPLIVGPQVETRNILVCDFRGVWQNQDIFSARLGMVCSPKVWCLFCKGA